MLWKQPNKYKDFFTLVVIYALISWLLYQIDDICIDTESAKVLSIMLFINLVAFTAGMYGWISSMVYIFGILIINFLFFGYMDDNSLYC